MPNMNAIKENEVDQLRHLLDSIDELANQLPHDLSIDDIWYTAWHELNNKSPYDIVTGRDIGELKMLQSFFEKEVAKK